MERYYVSEQFETFLMERISGPEFDFFQKRIGPLSVHPAHAGAFHEDFQAAASARTVRFSYYFSMTLGILFVLGAHLVRRGEPTDLDQGQMDEFMRAIQAWEGHPKAVPPAFRSEAE